jgi:hypothetical protein
MIRPRLVTVLAAVLALAAVSGFAQTAELEPMMDTTLYEDAGGNLANGSGSYLFVGETAQPLNRRALLAFDIAGEIPAGATITSVELTLEASRVSSSSDETIRLHRVTESWGEGASDAGGQEGSGTASAPGDATWIHRSFPDSEWMQAGGSFVPGASAERSVGGLGSYTWDSTPDLVSDVQAWLDEPDSNFGWIMVMTGTASGTAKRFNSRENGDAGSRPKLQIEYMVSGPTLDTLYYVPAAAKAGGAAGAFFLTDLDIQNGDSSSVGYQFLWLPRGQNNSDPLTSAAFTLAAGAAVRYRDVLGEVFGFDGDAVGALAILSDSRDLTLMSRTYNAPQAGGTFGQALPGFRADQLISTDERRRIVFLTEDSEFRSNLGLLNGTGEPIRIMWERFTPDGAAVDTGMIDLPPWGNTQLNRVFEDVRPVEAAYIDVWTPTPGGAFAAYGSVLDTVTSDPTTVLPQ